MDDERPIEVTPEMIEAGEMAFYDYDPRFERAPNMVARVYRAMAAARQREIDAVFAQAAS